MRIRDSDPSPAHILITWDKIERKTILAYFYAEMEWFIQRFQVLISRLFIYSWDLCRIAISKFSVTGFFVRILSIAKIIAILKLNLAYHKNPILFYFNFG